MKIIIAGSRDITDYDVICRVMQDVVSGWDISEVVCGMSDGVDLLGKRWAEERSIAVKEFPANWGLLGKMAGPVRNKEMVDYADVLVAILHKNSKGTLNCVQHAMNKPLKNIHIHFVDA